MIFWIKIQTEQMLLLMEEILHHLGFLKPCKEWDKLPVPQLVIQVYHRDAWI